MKIPAQFDSANEFSEGLAAVQVGDSFGYVNQGGTLVIRPNFVQAYPFVDGLALVRTGTEYAYIDTSGKIVMSGVFDGN